MGGEEERQLFCWFNSSWLTGGYLTFSISHTHTDQAFGNSHIVKCSTCDRIATNNNHTFSYKEIVIQEAGVIDNIPVQREVDAKYHYAVCDCGIRRPLPHNFVYMPNSDDLTHKKICSHCGYIAVERISHEFTYSMGGECIYCKYGSRTEEWG